MDPVLEGRYQLTREIARGAIGVVWRGVDLVTGDPVAVKMLRPEVADDRELVAGFVTEGKILAKLDHPSIARYRDSVRHEGRPALVMDLVAGEDLRRRLRRTGPVPPAVAADLVAQLADALFYLRSRDVVHGDVKPGNLVVPADGSPVRLVDFGAAHATDVGDPDRDIHATPEYVAPEVVLGARPTPASDVYSLGVVLFELLSGRSPYRGGSPLEVLGRHGLCAPVPPPGLPPVVWPIIEGCMAIDPGERPDPRLVAARLRGVEPALDGASPLPEPSADQVTWWPRPAGATTAVAKVGRSVTWVPLPAAPVSPAAAYSGPMVAVPLAVVGFESDPAGPNNASVVPVLNPGYGSVTRWPGAPTGPKGAGAARGRSRSATESSVPVGGPTTSPVAVPGGAGKASAERSVAGAVLSRRRHRVPLLTGVGVAVAVVAAVVLAMPLLGAGSAGSRAPADGSPTGGAPAGGAATGGAPAGPGQSAGPTATGFPDPGTIPGIGDPMPSMPGLP